MSSWLVLLFPWSSQTSSSSSSSSSSSLSGCKTHTKMTNAAISIALFLFAVKLWRKRLCVFCCIPFRESFVRRQILVYPRTCKNVRVQEEKWKSTEAGRASEVRKRERFPSTIYLKGKNSLTNCQRRHSRTYFLVKQKLRAPSTRVSGIVESVWTTWTDNNMLRQEEQARERRAITHAINQVQSRSKEKTP